MVLNGVDCIDAYKELFQNKRIGLITSTSGLNKDFESTIQIMNSKFNLVALFSPEHGVRGDLEAGALVDEYIDPYTNVKVYSLYRKDSKRLTSEMLDMIDVLVYDIQDIGSRYYTYISTLLYSMEDCAKAGKELIILDRINILGGDVVEGVELAREYHSFVGSYPMPVRYGLTVGELATMQNEEMNIGCDLKIVKVSGWKRSMLQPESGIPFIMPSLGIPRFETALLYPGTCMFEGTNVSEGRGTACPFEIIGAPYIDAYQLADGMNEKGLKGVWFRPVYFKPNASKHQGILCKGVQIHVLKSSSIAPFQVGIELLAEIQKQNEKEFSYLPPYSKGGRPFIDLLFGNEFAGTAWKVDEVLARATRDSTEFKKRKERFHLYE